MRSIALGYDRLALHAEQREAASIEALIKGGTGARGGLTSPSPKTAGLILLCFPHRPMMSRQAQLRLSWAMFSLTLSILC